MKTKDIVQENEGIKLVTETDVKNEINNINPKKHRDLIS